MSSKAVKAERPLLKAGVSSCNRFPVHDCCCLIVNKGNIMFNSLSGLCQFHHRFFLLLVQGLQCYPHYLDLAQEVEKATTRIHVVVLAKPPRQTPTQDGHPVVLFFTVRSAHPIHPIQPWHTHAHTHTHTQHAQAGALVSAGLLAAAALVVRCHP